MISGRSKFGMWALGGLLCALLITQGLELGDGPATVIQAQQDNWITEQARSQGIQLVETRDPSGSPAYPVEPGDLLFFTNASAGFGAKAELDAVVVINAKTMKPIGMSELDPEWAHRYVSHGITVSPDAKYVYLPGIAPRDSKNPSRVLVLDARTLKIAQIIVSGAERAHHAKVYEDWTGTPRVMIEDFNWVDNSPHGKGFYVLDHTDNNKVIAGMTPGDLRGAPYAGFTSPDGRYLYFSMPAPDRAIRGETGGWLAKIDMQTWQVAQAIAVEADPIWTVFSQDGKYAWVSMAHGSKVLKIERATGTGPGQMDKVVGEAPTGPGVYGLAMNIDDTEIWTADKGESTPAALKRTTVTVIDAATDTIKRTIETGCRTNDHVILSPDGTEMWATCNGSQEIVVVDTTTYQVKTRIPMPNQGASHGGTFVSYTRGPDGSLSGEVVADQNGLHGSAREARQKGASWVQPAS